MTSEHLLDAMGLLGDDLIREAEEALSRPAVPWRRWGSLAACAALVIALGYGIAHLRMDTSGSSSAGGAMPSVSSSWDAASPGGCETNGSTSFGGTEALRPGHIYTGKGVYAILSYTDALPEDSRPLGTLSASGPDAPYPATDVEEYAGCPLWEGADGALYLQLPGGGYGAAELEQPEPAGK